MFGLALCVLSGLAAASVKAAPPHPLAISYKGVTLAPAIVEVSLAKGQPTATFTIMVVNNTKKAVSLTPSSVDFKSLNASGGVAFLGNNASAVAHKYGLASWLTLPSAPLQLKPNQTRPVKITVENRADLSPGGHYAAVLFRASEDGPDGKTHIAINQVVSSLIFVRKIDGEQFGITLDKPATPTSWLHLPTSIDLSFKNTGNVQTVPRGLVTVISPRGREVARGIINTDSSLVLPESTRLFQTPLFKTGHSWLPGRYRVLVQYRSDGSSSLSSYQASFWYVNPLSIGLGLLVLIATGFAARTIWKLYRRRRTSAARHKPLPPSRRQIRID